MIREALDFMEQNRLYQVLFTVFVSFIVSKTSIPVIITISRLKNLMDIPGNRSSHDRKTPTLGGVAIFASILIGYFITQGLWPSKEAGGIINLTIVAIVILFFLGVKDDILVLSPAKKMVLQVASSALVIIGSDLRINNLFGIFGVYEINYTFSIILTIFIFIALINAMNLIDGIDGLAGGIGFIASFIFGIWFFINQNFALSFLAASVCGALIGFLLFNFSKTQKIFMGDTGSLILGFLLTIFAVKFINLNQEIDEAGNLLNYGSTPVIAIVVLIIPIFDTLRVFLVRILNKKSPFEGDRIHLHHILIDYGFSHIMATTLLCFTTLCLAGVFMNFREVFTNNESLYILIALFIIYLIVCYLLKTSVEKRSIVENIDSLQKETIQNQSTLN
jgi:UDP-GlcNAc:undecaprenyl-phosphate/decaprenyl-phosphate GlcNAc-1-phosphate transferase